MCVLLVVTLLASSCIFVKGSDTATNNCVWYFDIDEDGFGSPDVTVTTTDCADPPGYYSFVFDSTDCNDSENSAHPGATEICDGLDNDCDEVIDEGCDDLIDADGDGYNGDSSDPSTVDCDDNNTTVYPGAEEICDGLDNNCDGYGERDAVDMTTWYADVDEDGYGDINHHLIGCLQSSGYVTDSTDCDDTNAAINPSATEVCNDVDDDCDGLIDTLDSTIELGSMTVSYPDRDNDRFGDANSPGVTTCGIPTGNVTDYTDCNDQNAAVNPDATEIIDGVDNDCDGEIDEN